MTRELRLRAAGTRFAIKPDGHISVERLPRKER